MKYWERLEQRRISGNDLVCAVLELRGRVEALERGLKDKSDCNNVCARNIADRFKKLESKYETMRLAALEWGKDVEKLQLRSDRHLQRIEALESAENYRQQDEDAERAYEPDSSSSLLERVAATLHAVTNCDPNVPANEWKPEARAAIGVVAGELRAQFFVQAADWLEQEVNPINQEG